MARLFEKEKVGAGQFNLFAPRASLSPVAWFDTADGRTLYTTRTNDDGQTWVTCAPADNARIAQHLHTQLSGHL